MPKFTYIAKSRPGETIQGDIEAESEQEVIDKLTKIGYFPISVQTEDLSLSRQGIFRLRKISSRDTVVFTRQLSSLIESGVNILNSLNIIAGQSSNKYLKAVVSDIVSKIKDGKSLSDSLALHPHIFSNLFISMIHSGEIGGNLEQALKRLADFMEKEEEFKNSIRVALTYPAFILIVGILTVTILLGFVIPRLATMFEDMGQILPLPTRILIGFSDMLRAYGWLMLIIIATSVFLARRLYRSPHGRIVWDNFKLKRAIWGELVLKTELSRLMRTLSLLLSSGMPIIYSLDISMSVLENQVLKLQVQKFKDQIAAGLSFSSCIKNSPLFPELVSSIVAVGEETGTLERSLMRLADDYEKEVDRTLKTLTRLLEPVVILIMGLIVGFIVLSMLLPIFQINLIVR